MARLLTFLCALALSVTGSAALAEPKFPARGTAPVVDAANIIDDAAEAELTARLDAFEQRTQRQFVVATIPTLDGYEISDYGYQLGRAWGLGSKEDDNGIILLVAPTEHKVRIEVGYGLEAIIPDGLAYDIVNKDITPRFKAGDMTGGIVAGADRIMTQLELPPEEAAKVAAAAGQRRAKSGGLPVGMFVWIAFMFFFFILPLIARRGGRRYRGGGVGNAVGNVLLWSALNAASRGGSGSHGGGWSGGGGGFSGGGGSFGGGGASGGW